MKITSIIESGLYLSRLTLSLGIIWLTLDWRVRKAKKAFEKELVGAGMSKETAKRLADKYSSIKDEVTKQLWSSVTKVRPRSIHPQPVFKA